MAAPESRNCFSTSRNWIIPTGSRHCSAHPIAIPEDHSSVLLPKPGAVSYPEKSLRTACRCIRSSGAARSIYLSERQQPAGTSPIERHDILKWPNSAVFIYYNPQTMPWQGDVTDIANRPSESYVNNYQEVEFAPPYGYQGNPANVYSWMRVFHMNAN